MLVVVLASAYLMMVVDLLLVLRAEGKLDESLFAILIALGPFVLGEAAKRLR